MLEDLIAFASLLPDGVLLVTPDGAIVAANAACADVLGEGPDGLAGRTLGEVVETAPDDLERILAACRRSASPLPFSVVPRAGPARRVRCEGARLVVAGEPREVIALRCRGPDPRFELLTRKVDELNAEVLERRRAEREREEVIAQLARTVHLAEMFVGILGHDLRNPLSAVATSATLALRRAPDEALRRELDRILRSADRMARMIEQILDLSRIRLGQGLPVNRVPVDLAEVVRHAVGEIERAHPGRSFSVAVRGATVGEWDRDRMAQVLSNLVANAAQHSPPSSPVRVEVEGSAGEDMKLRVHNGGTAIPRERLASLFEPFSGSDRSRGLGLGLYITREIVVAHGGAIEVESADAAGTTFTVTLPRASHGDARTAGLGGGSGPGGRPAAPEAESPLARGAHFP